MLCMGKKGHFVETHSLLPYNWSYSKDKNYKDTFILRMNNVSVWIFLYVHIVCYTFNFAVSMWLLYLDFAFCSCV